MCWQLPVLLCGLAAVAGILIAEGTKATLGSAGPSPVCCAGLGCACPPASALLGHPPGHLLWALGVEASVQSPFLGATVGLAGEYQPPLSCQHHAGSGQILVRAAFGMACGAGMEEGAGSARVLLLFLVTEQEAGQAGHHRAAWGCESLGRWGRGCLGTLLFMQHLPWRRVQTI